MFLKTGKNSASYKDQTKKQAFLDQISKQKLEYENLIESLKELHDDLFVQSTQAQLKPLYDQLLDFENKIKKSQGILKFKTGLLKENGLKLLKKLKLIKAPKIIQSDPLNLFLKDPLLFLQNESFVVRNQLRKFKEIYPESLVDQLKALKEKISTPKFSLKQAKIKLAQCENEQKVLQDYKVLYDTYTVLQNSELFAFERTVNKEGKVVPLTNEAVVRFIAKALGIGLLDVFSLSRQELYDTLIAKGKTKGVNEDRRHRDLLQLLSNDFLWALELQKLEGHPVSIDHVHANAQLVNFSESYPQFSQGADMQSINALIKDIRKGLKLPVEEPVDAVETVPVTEPAVSSDDDDVFYDPVEPFVDQGVVQAPPPSISIIEEKPTVDEPPALSKVRSDGDQDIYHDALPPIETAAADPVEELSLPDGFSKEEFLSLVDQVEGTLPTRSTDETSQLLDINLISKEMIKIFKILTTPKQNEALPSITEVKNEFTSKLSQLNFFTTPKPTLEQKRLAVIDLQICKVLEKKLDILKKLQGDLKT